MQGFNLSNLAFTHLYPRRREVAVAHSLRNLALWQYHECQLSLIFEFFFLKRI